MQFKNKTDDSDLLLCITSELIFGCTPLKQYLTFLQKIILKHLFDVKTYERYEKTRTYLKYITKSKKRAHQTRITYRGDNYIVLVLFFYYKHHQFHRLGMFSGINHTKMLKMMMLIIEEKH